MRGAYRDHRPTGVDPVEAERHHVALLVHVAGAVLVHEVQDGVID